MKFLKIIDSIVTTIFVWIVLSSIDGHIWLKVILIAFFVAGGLISYARGLWER